MFITFSDLPHLGKTPWETPFGWVMDGMEDVVDKFYTGYGDQQPFNEDGISQGKLMNRGNEYLRCGACRTNIAAAASHAVLSFDAMNRGRTTLHSKTLVLFW